MSHLGLVPIFDVFSQLRINHIPPLGRWQKGDFLLIWPIVEGLQLHKGSQFKNANKYYISRDKTA